MINGLLSYAINVAREPSRHGDAGATCGLILCWHGEHAGDGTRHDRYVERELHPDAGLEPDIQTLALPKQKKIIISYVRAYLYVHLNYLE